MGLFDKLTQVAKSIDNLAGGVGLSELADSAKELIDDNLGPISTTSHTETVAPEPERNLTPAIVMNSVNDPIPPYKLADGGAWDEFDNDKEYNLSYEIPEDWTDFNSHAEPSMCFLYKFEDSDIEDIDFNKPVICITPELYDCIEEFEKTGSIRNAYMSESISLGKMYMRAKIKRLDNIVYFYAFHELNSSFPSAISLWYKPDVKGTPLEQKLMKILDHAAATYMETPAE